MTTYPTNPGEVLARTLWAEARNQGRAGMEAVACVVLNRARNPRWWGGSIRDVCLHPYQFSCWLPEPTGQLARLLAVTTADPTFKVALAVSADALAGRLVDHTGGADSYVNLSVARPAWVAGRTPCAVIGAHTFYRLELPAPSPAAAVLPKVVAAPVSVPGQPQADALMAAEMASKSG